MPDALTQLLDFNKSFIDPQTGLITPYWQGLLLNFFNTATETENLLATANSTITTLQAEIDAAQEEIELLAGAASFHAYRFGSQTFAHNTLTRVAFNQTVFNHSNWYDTTNYRFLPLRSGNYLFLSLVRFGNGGAIDKFTTYLSKHNGTSASLRATSVVELPAASSNNTSLISVVVEMDGVDDYIYVEGINEDSGAGSTGIYQSIGASYLMGYRISDLDT